MKLKEKTKALANQGRMMTETMAKVLEEPVKEQVELMLRHYQVVEQSKKVQDMVQTTCQTKLMEYELQAKATTGLIKQLKNGKEATKDKVKMGIQGI